MERYVGGVAVIGLGIAFMAGVPPRWWPGMPSGLLRFAILLGAILFIVGAQLMVVGACQEVNVAWCGGVIDTWDYLTQGRVLLWVLGGIGVLLVAYSQFGGDRSFQEMRLVRQQLAYLDGESKDWLRKLLTDDRPVSIPYRIGQTLERTGLVERDPDGKGAIIEEYRPRIQEWLKNELGGQRNITAALLIAAGVCFFITGAVLYASRSLPSAGSTAAVTEAPPAEAEQFPSLDLLYHDKQFQIRNTGRAPLHLWGTKLSETGQKVLESEPQYIAPGGSYYIPAEHMDKELSERITEGSEARMRFQLYLIAQSGREVTMDFILLIRVQNKQVSIRSQVLGAFDGW
jgi:hypothetical protein